MKIPTLRETGMDFTYFMQRSVVGAPQMSAEARAYYEQLFRKLFESQEWQQYRAKNSLFSEFTTGTALMGYGCASARSMRAGMAIDLMRPN